MFQAISPWTIDCNSFITDYDWEFSRNKDYLADEEPLPEDYYEDYDEVLIGEEIPEEELEELVEEIITLRSIDRKEFEDLARSQGTQIALEKFALREYSRKKLGRKLTEKEKEQRKRDRLHANIDNWEVDLRRVI